MEPVVLNPNLIEIGNLDVFETLIWTDRYYSCGDFEITSSPTNYFIQQVFQGLYLQLKESDHVMLIEYIDIHSEVERGRRAIVKGRSLESILDRRIVYAPTVLENPPGGHGFQAGIEKLLNENAINPANPDRKISRLEFVPSADPAITSLDIGNQYWGENLYKVIGELCIAKNVGFKMTLTPDNKFRFQLYAGVDRSYDNAQDNPWVVFSPRFENLLTADYKATSQIQKTVTLVAGELGVGNYRQTVEISVAGGAGTDLQRREMFTDAQGVTRNLQGGGQLSDQEYLEELRQKGAEDLARNTFIQSFEGQADASFEYSYGTDFWMGDIVQVENEYKNQAKARVVELIHSQDPTGIKIYPSFTSLGEIQEVT